jgi:hypothetical protein
MKFVAWGEKTTPASNDITVTVNMEAIGRGGSYTLQKDRIVLSGDKRQGQIA